MIEATPPVETPAVIRTEHIAKRFGAVTALRDISMYLNKGEILGLVGDNGAGKSTLIKILTGFQPPSSGEIYINGVEVKLRSVTHAHTLGIETVYQDLALVNELTVFHNMFLNRELRYPGLPFLNNRKMREQAREQLNKIGINIPSIDAEVAKLSGGQRQAIAIARAISTDAKILLLDEPLAAMGAKEGALILELIHNLKTLGEVSIIMIAHNYSQVLETCDRVNLLQHGTITFDKLVADTSLEELNELVMREYRLAATKR
ncbi:MAG TPA: ATP-binding cassette domain-containing protein [Ktedonobacteraceae bacterium]|nr:ATP-binding cassette domain-containing protein [Ktedonobacteraceae bacterium]